MSERQFLQFGQRVRRVVESHKRLANGHVAVMNSRGLIVAQPQKMKSHRAARSLFLCLIIMWAFKVFLLASIGATTYEQRVVELSNGTMVQQVGAFVMKADPVTSWLAAFVGSV